MGASVNEVYKFVQFIANKDQDGGYISPEEFNDAAKICQIQWVEDLYNNPQQYQYGSPVPRVGYEATQKITDDLSFLKVVSNLSVDAQGYATIPQDYNHASSLRYRFSKMAKGSLSVTDVEVVYVTDAAIGNRLSNPITEPKHRYPIYTQYATQLRIWPNDIAQVEFTYLRYPIAPVWAFTEENGSAVYDPANSVDFEVSEENTQDLSMRICSYLGMNLREADLVQYSESLKAQG